MSQTLSGGVLVCASSAAATHGGAFVPHGSPSYVSNAQNVPWYARYRFKIATAPDANTRLFLGAADPTVLHFPRSFVRFGVKGNTSFVTWYWDSLDSTGAIITSGTFGTIDNAWHTLELWNNDTTLNIGFDLGSSTTPTATTASTNIQAAAMSLAGFYTNLGSAANQEIDVDSSYMVVAGN